MDIPFLKPNIEKWLTAAMDLTHHSDNLVTLIKSEKLLVQGLRGIIREQESIPNSIRADFIKELDAISNVGDLSDRSARIKGFMPGYRDGLKKIGDDLRRWGSNVDDQFRLRGIIDKTVLDLPVQ